MALTKEGTAYGPLRWKVGDDVECWWRTSDAPGCWLRGTVLSHWWRSEQWPKGQYAPYQVRLSNGTLIFAPRDDDSCIRESAPDLDLDPDRPEEEPPGVPTAMPRSQGPPPPQEEGTPWRQVKTKDGKTYYYHPITKETSWDDPDKKPRTRQHAAVRHDLPGPQPAAATLPERVRQAAEEGNKEVVNNFLSQNPGSVDAADAQGRTLLMTAAFGNRGSEEIVHILLGQRASPDQSDQDGSTALMYASVKGRDHVAAMLLQAGASAGLKDRKGGTALHLATMLGHPPLVQRLLLAGADAKQVHEGVAMDAVALAEAAAHAEILALLRRPADERAQPLQLSTEVGLHGLRWMASDNAMALAQQLGPLVLKMAGHARSVTLAHAARQAPKVLPELLRGDVEMHAVMLWVNQGGSVDACDEDGVSLLMRQVNQGKLQLAERLLQMHASVDAVDKRGRTALMSASGSGREEEVGLLLHYKAAVNLVDSSGYTALLRASCMGRAGCVQRLLAAGAKKDLKDPSGRTALHVAEQLGHHAVAVQLRGAQREGGGAAGKAPAPSAPSTKDRVRSREGGKLAAGAAEPRVKEPRPKTKLGADGLPVVAPPGSSTVGGGGRGAAAAAQDATKLPVQLYGLAQGAADPGAQPPPPTFAEALQRWQAAGGSLEAHYPQHGWTLLMAACAAGREAEARLLLDAKALPDAVSVAPRRFVTALVAACTDGHEAVVALLLARGASADPPALLVHKGPPNTGFAALHSAAAAGHIGCVRRLLQAGARINLQHPRTGLTPLRAAEAHGQLAVALLLKVSTKRAAPPPSTAGAPPTSKEGGGEEPAPAAPPSAEPTPKKPTPEREPAVPAAAAPAAPPAPPTAATSGKKGGKKKRDAVVDVADDLAAVD